MKHISIKCVTSHQFKIEELNFFQGKLKSISESNFKKLKQSLIKHGLPLAFHVWIDSKQKIWIIDGHHRFLALKSLIDDGYQIDSIPCNLVTAKTKKEAAQIVLISNSKYAKMSDESLSDFMIDFELKMDDLEFLDLNDLTIDLLNNEEKKESEEQDIDFKYKIEIDCETEEKQQELLNEMEQRGFQVRVLI